MVQIPTANSQPIQTQQSSVNKATETPTTSIPYNGSGTINIHVNNPTASVAPMPYYCYPPAYYMGYPNGVNQIVNVNSDGKPTSVTNKHPGGANASANATANADSADKKKEREITILTDNYVKTLENYLKNSNIELRKNAIKEVLMRFKEDKSRVDNPSLTALLNIALQDTNSTVKAIAMSIVQSGYAKGDKLTEELLKKIQTTKNKFAQDAIQATDGLLQMAKTTKMVPDNSFYPDKSSKKKG